MLSPRRRRGVCLPRNARNATALAAAGRGFDELAGESARELYGELREMKYRTRIESIMDRQARGYTDQQLRTIADYFASLPGSGD